MSNTKDTRTAVEKSQFRAACRNLGVIRVYFYDIDTREEITLGSNSAGLPWYGTGCAAIRRGVRYMDTRLTVGVVCFDTKTMRTVTAADFPGRRVAVKIWIPEGHYGEGGPATEFVYLADERNGFAGNEADNGKVTRGTFGTAARAEAVHV